MELCKRFKAYFTTERKTHRIKQRENEERSMQEPNWPWALLELKRRISLGEWPEWSVVRCSVAKLHKIFKGNKRKGYTGEWITVSGREQN